MIRHSTARRDTDRSARISVSAIVSVVVLVASSSAVGAAELKPTALQPEPHKCAASRARAAGLSGYLPVTRAKPVPLTPFYAPTGSPASVANWKGRGLVLNFWATWCPPCVRELPALAALRQSLEQHRIDVVIVNEDRAGKVDVAAFLKNVGAKSLTPYIDQKNALMKSARIVSLPTTLLISSDGDEVAAVLSDADWSDPAIVAFVARCLAPEPLASSSE